MNNTTPEAKEVFLSALDCTSPEDLTRHLDEACRGDASLRERVEELLLARRQAGSFLGGRWMLATEELAIAESPGTVIGPYKLLQQIGEGGMGVVFMAEQTEPLQRTVALKIIKPGMDTRQVIARFEAERQALAMMDHPNIAKVLDAGTTDSGRPYFVMELVKGVPITKYCDEKHLPLRARLKLLLPVCQAVQHAHQKGLIHRDIKPTNVLVAEYDDHAVPKVIDFGVAKATAQKLTDRTMFTEFGQVLGTVEYMSPEQAKFNQLDIDTRSDIYSLGVLLYELLTGSTPFARKRLNEAAFDEMLRIIREEEPPKPSTRLITTDQLPGIAANRGLEPKKLSGLVRGELDWVVMKALEKDRNRRYETTSAFAADIARYLADEPVQACPPSAIYRFRKFARRNKAAVLMALVIGAAVFLTMAGLSISQRTTKNALQAETKAKADLQETLGRERRDSYFHRITLAHRELSADNLSGALKFLDECPEDLREWEWHYLMRLCRVEPLVLRNKTGVNGVAFSPDGERLASAGGDGTINIWNSSKIWNRRTGTVVQTFPAHSDAVLSVVFHPDGKHLASVGADRKVKGWDLTATGEAVFTEPCDVNRKFGMAYTVAFSPDGRQLAAGSDGAVRVWDWKNRQLLQTLPRHNFHSIPVAFSGDGRLATGTFREGLKLWDPETGLLLRTIHAHRHPVSALAFSPDGKWLASASFDRTVKLSDSTTGEPLRTFDLHTGNVECVAFSRNGRRLASGGEDKTVRVWDAMTGREVLGLHGHTDRCGCVAFSPDGRRLASASSDGTIRFWDATPLRRDEGRQEILTFTRHTDEIRSVAFSPDGQRIASAGTEGLVKVWDAKTGRVSVEFSGHRDFSGNSVAIFCVAWHPKGHLIASVGLDTVKVWDARTEREVFKLPAGLGPIAVPYSAVAFSPDGRYLVTGKVDGPVQVWDAGTGQEVGPLGTHHQAIRGVVFSRDGEHLASASSDGIVKLWDAKRLDKQHLDGKLEPRIPPIRARVAGPSLNVAFSPDGRRLATGGEKNTVKIWDVQTGETLQTLAGQHSGEVYALAFSPNEDGRWVASAGEDSAVKVWDSHTGTFVRSFRGHTGLISSVAFSPDGGRLVSGSRDHTVKVWDVTQLEKLPEESVAQQTINQ